MIGSFVEMTASSLFELGRVLSMVFFSKSERLRVDRLAITYDRSKWLSPKDGVFEFGGAFKLLPAEAVLNSSDSSLAFIKV